MIKSQISLSESQCDAGLSGQALVPPAVAHREKAAILRCPDLQTVVLCEPHWGESVTVKISYITPIENSKISIHACAYMCLLTAVGFIWAQRAIFHGVALHSVVGAAVVNGYGRVFVPLVVVIVQERRHCQPCAKLYCCWKYDEYDFRVWPLSLSCFHWCLAWSWVMHHHNHFYINIRNSVHF